MMKRVMMMFLVCLAAGTSIYSQGRYLVVENEKTGMKGCLDVVQNKMAIPYEYEEISDMDNGYFAAAKMSKMGLVDSTGKVCLPFQYDYGAHIDSEYKVAWVKKNGVYGLVDFQNQVILPFEYDDIHVEVKGGDLQTVCKNGKYGILSHKQKKLVVPLIYEDIRLGAEVFSNLFETMKNTLQSDLIAVKKNGKWGFIDLNGNIKIPCKYDDDAGLPHETLNYKFRGGRSTFIRNGLFGLINEQGQEVVPAKYKRIFMWAKESRLSAVDYPTATLTNGKEVIIGKNNREWTAQYDEIWSDRDSIIVYKKGDKYGIIDMMTGKELTPANYDAISNIREGYIMFKKDGKIGYMNRFGNELFNNVYESGSAFWNGYCVVGQNGKKGYIRANGKTSTYIDCVYEEAHAFQDYGLAIVKKDGKYGCINTMNKAIVPFKYDNVWTTDNNIFVVNLGDSYGAVDHDGEEVVPCKYNRNDFNKEMMIYVQSKKMEKAKEQAKTLPVAPSADVFGVKEMYASGNDISASVQQVNDLNGNACALIKVQVLDELVKVEGNVLETRNMDLPEKWVYMSEGTKQVNLIFRNHLPIMVYFNDYGVPKLQGKVTYVMTIK